MKYDVKALRRIKSQLYELVKTNKPTEKLYVATNIDDDSQDVDFVVGVGVYGKFGKVGYGGIKAEELYLYAIGQSDLQYDDDMILKEAIPYLYNGRTIWPVRQFVSRCQSSDSINGKVKFSLDKTSKDLLSIAQKESIKRRGYAKHDGCSVRARYFQGRSLYPCPQQRFSCLPGWSQDRHFTGKIPGLAGKADRGKFSHLGLAISLSL